MAFAAANAGATALVDKTTSSRWSPYGECVSGPLKGTVLEGLVLEAFHRDTAIYSPPRP